MSNMYLFVNFHFSANDDDLNHISTISKRALNKLSGSCQISKQESVHEIAGLDLVICLDYLTDVSLGKALYLRQKDDTSVNNKDLISSYRNRPLSEKHYPLEKCFYHIFCKNKFYVNSSTKRQKHRILIPKGLNCRPCYPVDYDYAKGMLVMHKPWSKRNPLTKLLRDEEKTIQTFLDLLENRKMPHYVYSEYYRAIHYSTQWRYECLSKKTKVVKDVNLDDLSLEELEDFTHWDHSQNISVQGGLKHDDHVGEVRVNI